MWLESPVPYFMVLSIPVAISSVSAVYSCTAEQTASPTYCFRNETFRSDVESEVARPVLKLSF